MGGITHASRRTVRVVVAEPDDELRSTYRNSLQRAGCDVLDASDGRDALVMALSHRPTLVVTETRLPLLDGYALCEVLRKDSMTRTVPILVVTAEERPTELERARRAGADLVLIKPITPDALLNEIQRLIGAPVEPAPSPVSPAGEAKAGRRQTRARSHARFATNRPANKPPDLVCPACDRSLVYEGSHIGGISSLHPEQWDDFMCPDACGTFVYRHRTRKLRRR